jgi:hypothetical protein
MRLGREELCNKQSIVSDNAPRSDSTYRNECVRIRTLAKPSSLADSTTDPSGRPGVV